MQDPRESRQRLILAHEQTKKEVANLIHAQVQSRLLVLGFWLKDCQELLEGGPTEAIERLGNARTILGEIIEQDLRSITRHLYPSIIRVGLPSALNSLAERFRCLFDVQVDMDGRVAEIEEPISSGFRDDLRLAVYRVVEEALTNVAKHSKATKTRIFLEFSSPEEICLTVQDDGQGFEPRDATPGHGQLSMEDYVEAQGGRLEVHSAPGLGTTVKAWIPVSEGVQQLAGV